MVKRCQWGKCNSDTRFPDRLEGGKVQFHPFPRPTSREADCRIWIQRCGRPSNQLNIKKIKKHFNFYVCSKHFVGGSISAKHPYPVQAGSEEDHDTPVRRLRGRVVHRQNSKAVCSRNSSECKPRSATSKEKIVPSSPVGQPSCEQETGVAPAHTPSTKHSNHPRSVAVGPCVSEPDSLGFQASRASGSCWEQPVEMRDIADIKSEPIDDLILSFKLEPDIDIHEDLPEAIRDHGGSFVMPSGRLETGEAVSEEEPERILPDWPEEESMQESRPEADLSYLVLLSHHHSDPRPFGKVQTDDRCFETHANMALLHDHSYFMTHTRHACTQTTTDWQNQAKRLRNEIMWKTQRITSLESRVKLAEEKVTELKALLEWRAPIFKRMLLRTWQACV